MSTKTTGNLKLTTRGRYAVMAMVDLASNENKNPVPLVEIAKSGNISLSYLEQLFAGLRRHGLVRSYRGPGGGYILAKAPTDIMISDILISAEDSVPAKRSASNENNGQVNEQTKALWSQISEMLHLFTQRISLDDVINNRLKENAVINKLFDNRD